MFQSHIEETSITVIHCYGFFVQFALQYLDFPLQAVDRGHKGADVAYDR